MAQPKAADRFDFRRPAFMMGEVPRTHFSRRYSALKTERDELLTEWIDISDNFNPRRGRYLNDPKADKRPRRVIGNVNNKGVIASRTLGSGMMSGISSPSRPWFRLTTPDPDMAKFGRVKIWLSDVAQYLYAIFGASNTYEALQAIYRDCGDFGNASMIIDEDFEDVIRCTPLAPGEFYFATSYRGNVNTLYRDVSFTVIQLVHRYGNRCSQVVLDMYDRGAYDEPIACIEAIEPNFNQIPTARGPKRAPYMKVLYEANAEREAILDIRPYHEWPAPSPRWDIQTGDVYGSGCGALALGDTRGLQKLERKKAQAVDKIVTPPMTGPTSLKNQPVSHLPGGMTYVDQAGGAGLQAFRAAYEIQAGAVREVREEIREHSERIDTAYFVPLFMMMAQSDRREITAREVEERHEEKLLQLGPVLERLHGELLNPLIDRAFAVALRAKILPPPPEELHGVQLKVEFISMLAQAQKAVSVGATERFTGFLGNVVAAYPGARHKFNPNKAIDHYADAVGVDPAIIVSDDDANAAAEQEAKQAQAAAAMQMTTEGANAAKVLSEAKTSDESLLTQIAGMA